MSQANQGHLIEVLKQAIGDARNNKKILFSTMQSVISLMREVELKEEAADQAKVETAMAGSDVLAKVEEFKQMIQLEKGANCMLVGEVHGEKSILASELWELQSHVLLLLEERDISLAVLDDVISNPTCSPFPLNISGLFSWMGRCRIFVLGQLSKKYLSKAFVLAICSLWPGVNGNAAASTIMVSKMRKRAAQRLFILKKITLCDAITNHCSRIELLTDENRLCLNAILLL